MCSFEVAFSLVGLEACLFLCRGWVLSRQKEYQWASSILLPHKTPAEILGMVLCMPKPAPDLVEKAVWKRGASQ